MIEKNRLKILLPIALLLAGIASAWAVIATRPQMVLQAPPLEAPLVTVIQAEPQTLRLNVHSQGVVTPRNEIDLIPEVSGKVVQLHPDFVTGGFFARNDLLVSIDPRDYDYAIAQAQAQIAEAKRQLAMEEAQADQAHNEWQALGEGAATPLAMREPQLAEARAKLKAAEANLLQAQIKRSRCELRAPFTGRLQTKLVGLGQTIQSGEKLAHIYSTDLAEIRLPLPTDQLAYLDLPLGSGGGQCGACLKVTLTADFAGALQTWEGHIVRSEGKLDDATGVLYVVAEVVNPYTQKIEHPPLLAGLFVQALVQGKELQNLFVLPQVAINASQQALVVDADLRLHIRHLDVLRNEPDRILVKGGLNAGDRIVTSGIHVPVEGMKVRIE
ncbi:MAG: efflux RND transporter periplasmic adaptor subunit [Methylobacter sp.]|nr:efflux RND transporter periplasmic adaptor subunit [Methylobacter sp.]